MTAATRRPSTRTGGAARFHALGRHALKTAAAARDLVRRPADGIVVLIYHRVGGGSGLQIDLDVDVFRRQIEAIAEAGNVMTLDDAVVAASDSSGGARSTGTVVTFDDGTADFVDHAVPVLAEFRVPATLYVATRFVEEHRSFPNEGRPVTWTGLAEAVSTGLVSVGSHTHTHALLDRVDDRTVDDELDRSVDLIGERLGAPARHFAYPKAVPGSSYADAAVRERFASAALAGSRANRAPADPHRLARTPIQASDSTRWFRRKLAGGMSLEEDMRIMLSARRYRHATS